jgi:hypothetical protein
MCNHALTSAETHVYRFPAWLIAPIAHLLDDSISSFVGAVQKMIDLLNEDFGVQIMAILPPNGSESEWVVVASEDPEENGRPQDFLEAL